MQGFVEKRSEEQSQTGKTYWNVYVNGQRYSVWDRDVADRCEPGANIEFLVREKGDFKNITKVLGASNAPMNAPVNNTPKTETQDESLKKTCLECSALLVAHAPDIAVSDRPDWTIEIMKALYKAFKGEKTEEAPLKQDDIPF